jgi:uncharacterized protein YndB with AHSA1/START domain
MSRTETRTVEVSRRVNGSREAAFSYFTDAEKHARWQGVSVDLDPRPGGDYIVHFNEQSRIRGEYLVVERPSRIVLSWGWESRDQFPDGMRELPPSSTQVEISFLEDGDGTIIRLRHTGLPTDLSSEATNFGWTVYLDRLLALLGGEALDPDPSPAFLETLPATA